MNTSDWQVHTRVVVTRPFPDIDCGSFPVKGIVGRSRKVSCALLCDSHDLLKGWFHFKKKGEKEFRDIMMESVGNDLYQTTFIPEDIGIYYFSFSGCIDRFGTWSRDFQKKLAAGVASEVDREIGINLLRSSGEPSTIAMPMSILAHTHHKTIDVAPLIRSLQDLDVHHRDAALYFEKWNSDHNIPAVMGDLLDIASHTILSYEIEFWSEPTYAEFSSWYEFFPRSIFLSDNTSNAPPSTREKDRSQTEAYSHTDHGSPAMHGSFESNRSMLEYVANAGFDVVYLPPIHPIGVINRKGRNNTLEATEDDVGSPWAIGSREGGHKSIHPELGGLDGFRSFLRHAKEFNLKVALDIAFQCAPDHPYVKEHPEWFIRRPDGNIQYAENPPKKYQDIYPLSFEGAHQKELFLELKSVFMFWIEEGVSIFRVDNPHTKPFAFWEWLIREIKEEHPEVVFLSEAFTRPLRMRHLAKCGFTQSYTYFTWRNTKYELEEFVNEFFNEQSLSYLRPSLWPNTPDILPEPLQYGGRAAFITRTILAGTLSSVYGIYGPVFELCVGQSVRQGSEEYDCSEKYQVRHWNLRDPESIIPIIARVNAVRRKFAAFQRNEPIEVIATDNGQLFAFLRHDPDADQHFLIIVNLDHHHTQSGFVDVPIHRLGVEPSDSYQVYDLIKGERYLWSGWKNYVELNPGHMPVHVFQILKKKRSEQDFDYYE